MHSLVSIRSESLCQTGNFRIARSSEEMTLVAALPQAKWAKGI
jgi:hypothetical protein